MTKKLLDKTALVTGSSRGIGRAVALRLASEGADVVVHCRSRLTEAEEVAALVRRQGRDALVVQGDLSDLATIERIFVEFDGWSDGRPLDILVGNAAVHGASGSFESVTSEEFDLVVATNLRAPFFVAQNAQARMGSGGRIIFIGAIASTHAYPFEPVYAATKGALTSLTLALARHLGPKNITVNTVVPGVTDTEMLAPHQGVPGVIEGMVAETSLQRIGSPEDVADVVAFVASEDGRWLTGEAIRATGGLWI